MSNDEETPTGEPEQPVTAIVRAFRLGEVSASRRVRARVRRIVAYRGYGFDREDRRDLEQKIMVELWKAVHREDLDPRGFWGLVEVVTSRRCIDLFRAGRREVALEAVEEPSDRHSDPLREVLEKERDRRAKAALARLPKECRELLRLQAVERKSYREISALLGRSEAALRVQLHRCIKRAQQALADE